MGVERVKIKKVEQSGKGYIFYRAIISISFMTVFAQYGIMNLQK